MDLGTRDEGEGSQAVGVGLSSKAGRVVFLSGTSYICILLHFNTSSMGKCITNL